MLAKALIITLPAVAAAARVHSHWSEDGGGRGARRGEACHIAAPGALSPGLYV